jgi:uncharacterized protein YkwD
MFRKTWKTIKIFLIIGAVLLCIPHSILPKQSSQNSKETLESLLILNEKETRLLDFKDDEATLRIKLEQLDVINASRKKFKAQPVQLDILASRVANKMSKEAGEIGFTGHWNTAGEKPYHRYAFGGGYDHVSENAFGEWSSDNYDITDESTLQMMKSAHGKFMAERAPADGHKKNIIEKGHNFVGIGLYFKGKQFRYYEEFLDRYLEYQNIPSEVKQGEQFSITVKTPPQTFLYYLIVYREKIPKPLTVNQLKAKGSYEDYTDEDYISIPAWELSRYRSGNVYKIPLKFSKDGLFYVHIYTDKSEISKASSISTKGKTPVSGIVIKAGNGLE